jgi:3-dehydroquinate synthase
MDDILKLDKTACEHIAEENCRIKYEVVMKDERESGLREVLNLGHTVGRAVETVSDYELMHGEAVSIGLVAAVDLSLKLELLSKDDRDRVVALLAKAGLPTEIPSYIDREVLVKKLYTDKKVRDGKLRFVLQDGIGSVKEFEPGVFATPISEELAREIIMGMN